ncbi:MAG: hypothetical protein Q9227_001916 [Pyrenula ochraceoflavens]
MPLSPLTFDLPPPPPFTEPPAKTKPANTPGTKKKDKRYSISFSPKKDVTSPTAEKSEKDVAPAPPSYQLPGITGQIPTDVHNQQYSLSMSGHAEPFGETLWASESPPADELASESKMENFTDDKVEYMSNERGPSLAPSLESVELKTAYESRGDSFWVPKISPSAQSAECEVQPLEYSEIRFDASNHCPASNTEQRSFQLSPGSGTDLESSTGTETEEDSNESETLSPLVSRLIAALSYNAVEGFLLRSSRQYSRIRQHVAGKRSRSGGTALNPSGIASQEVQGARNGRSTILDEDNDPDDGDEDQNEEPNGKRERLSGQSVHRRRLLACPYSKFDPTKYSERNHEDRTYRGCSSCLIRDIPKLKDESDAHLNMDQVCERRGIPYPEKMTEDQWKQVEKRRLGLGVVANWRLIFRLIFPDISEADVPESPFVPASAQEVVSDFLCYFNREAPRLLLSEIQHRIDLPSMSERENLIVLNAALEQSVSNVIRRVSEGASNCSALIPELSMGEEDRSSSQASSVTIPTPQLGQARVQNPPAILPSSEALPPLPPGDPSDITVESMLQELQSESTKVLNDGWDTPFIPPLDNLEWAFTQMQNEQPSYGSIGEDAEYNAIRLAASGDSAPAAQGCL